MRSLRLWGGFGDELRVLTGMFLERFIVFSSSPLSFTMVRIGGLTTYYSYASSHLR